MYMTPTLGDTLRSGPEALLSSSGGVILCSSGKHPEQTLFQRIMTQQQLLQNARGVLVLVSRDAQRKCLQSAATAAGRKAEAVSKASTMRLALWVSKGTSAI